MARYVPQTHFFGAGALAILVNSLNGAGTGSLGELDSHAKSGEQGGLLKGSGDHTK